MVFHLLSMGAMKQNSRLDFRPDRLDMLVLKTLSRGVNHGWGP
jgi:hypothetical protein